jgi:hypothetical protein
MEQGSTLDEFNKSINKIRAEIAALDQKLKEASLKNEKARNEIKNLSDGAEKYRKENPGIAKQMADLHKQKVKEYARLKLDLKQVRIRQALVQQELKRLFIKINTWKKTEKAKPTEIAPKPEPIPPAPVNPLPPPVKTEVVEKKVEEKPAPKVPVPPKVKPVKNDDFHARAAEEAEGQAKYLKSLNRSSKNYGDV